MKMPKMNVPNPPAIADPWKNCETLNYEIKIVTPIMGGGASANKAEECFAVRPSEIRGHLRFWWRQLFAKNLEGDALRMAETAIWGDSKTASKVRIEVDGANFTAKRMMSADYFGFKRYSKESYALFPLDSDEDPGCSIVKEGGKFSCRVVIRRSLNEEQIAQVKASVDAWILLGGVGARTRRGLGCLQSDSVDSSVLSNFKVLAGVNGSDPMTLWANGLSLYKNFRQDRRPGQERNRPGRSFWPEAESCRKATGQRLAKHESLGEQLNGMGAVDSVFTSPKAALGMPIIVHFKDNKPHQDPEDVMVNVDGKEGRMGSPVIVKPLFVDGAWHPVFVFLKNTAQEALGNKIDSVRALGKSIKSKDGAPVKVQRDNAVPAKHLGITETGDAIVALQQYVEKNGYKKIGGDK